MIRCIFQAYNGIYVRHIPMVIRDIETLEKINLTLVTILNSLSDIDETDSYNRILP